MEHTTKCFIIVLYDNEEMIGGKRMDKKLALLGTVALLVFLAGCMGSGEETDDGPEMEEKKAMLAPISGVQSGLAQATPELVVANVPIILDFQKVTMIQVNITVEDGDENTNDDKVDTMTLSEETGNVSKEGQGGTAGSSPVTSQITIEWDGTQYLSERWVLEIPVTINGGDDTWIGPLIWRGVPDRGFKYHLDVYYEYQEEPS